MVGFTGNRPYLRGPRPCESSGTGRLAPGPAGPGGRPFVATGYEQDNKDRAGRFSFPMEHPQPPPTSGTAPDDPRPGPPSETGADLDTARRIRIGAKALVTAPGRVFLVKERREDGSTFWTLPGGGARPGESLAACLRREVSEEVQCESTVGPAVTTCAYRHTTRPVTTVYPVFVAVLERTPEPNPDEGIVDCAWRAPTDLPRATLDPFRRVVETTVAGPDPNAPGVGGRCLRTRAADRDGRPSRPPLDGEDIIERNRGRER